MPTRVRVEAFFFASDDDGDGAHYLRAMGRDVDFEEGRLNYDRATRILTLTGTGSRKVGKMGRESDALDQAVLDVVPAEPGLNTTQIQGKVRESGVGAQHGDVGKAATRLVDLGALRMEVGPRKAHNYFPTTTYPVLSRRVPRDSTSPIPTPYRGGRW